MKRFLLKKVIIMFLFTFLVFLNKERVYEENKYSKIDSCFIYH
jgi:hypothetical protein